MTNSILSSSDHQHFEDRGFVRLGEAFSTDHAERMRAEIWAELEEDHGFREDDRSTWGVPPHSPRRAKHSPSNEGFATPRLTGAIGELLGRDDWPRPGGWGGFNVIFPSQDRGAWDVPTEIWHWDGSPTSTGLLIFFFYSEVRPGGGGTLVVEGSHRLVRAYYDSLSPEDLARPHKTHRKELSTWDPWLADLTGQGARDLDRKATFMESITEVRGIPLRVAELTGSPGDAILCDLSLLHAVAPNTSRDPRFVRVKFLIFR